MPGRPTKFANGKKPINVVLPIELFDEAELCRTEITKRTPAGKESPLDLSEYVREALYHQNSTIRAGRYRSFRQADRLDEYPIVKVGRPAPRPRAERFTRRVQLGS